MSPPEEPKFRDVMGRFGLMGPRDVASPVDDEPSQEDAADDTTILWSIMMRSRPPRSASGFAVRVDWPDGGHTLPGFSADRTLVIRRRERYCRLWRLGPRAAFRVVAVTAAQMEAHRGRVCRDVECRL